MLRIFFLGIVSDKIFFFLAQSRSKKNVARKNSSGKKKIVLSINREKISGHKKSFLWEFTWGDFSASQEARCILNVSLSSNIQIPIPTHNLCAKKIFVSYFFFKKRSI